MPYGSILLQEAVEGMGITPTTFLAQRLSLDVAERICFAKDHQH